MRRLIPVLAIALAAAAPLAAQSGSQSQGQQNEQKPEAKPAPSLPGKWNMSTTVNGNQMVNVLTVKLDGKKVTGTMAGQMGEVPLEGEFADGKLFFSISVASNGNNIPVQFYGGFKNDGTLAGTLNYGQGEIPWTAERVKEK